MKNAEKPILSISLLTSDRMKTIPRCLDSLLPLREAIPCELIIVDTSKSPEVHEYALSHTDLVEEFEWCNDFAKARNVGLKKAKGEWFMFIDDDEWFMEIEPLIEFFQSGEYKEYGYAHYRVRNYHDVNFESYADGWVSRLVKLQPDTAFHSKVHEYLAPYEGKDKSLDALIGHSGYVYVSKEDKKKHFDRNTNLIKKMEEEEPDNLRWKVQQIQEYRSIQAWDELEQYCEKTMKYLEKEERTVVLLDLVQIYIGYAIALINVKKNHEVKQVYKNSEPLLKGHLLSKAYMDSCMAEAYFNLEEYDLMKPYINNYLDAFKEYQKEPKKHERESLRIILGETFGNKKLYGMNSMLLSAEIKNGDYKSIYTIYPLLKWGEIGNRAYAGVEVEILRGLIALKDNDMLKTVLQESLSSRFIKPMMMKAILDWKQKDEAVFLNLLELVKQLDIEAWYKPYAAILTAENASTKETVYEYAVDFIKSTPDIFEIPNEVKDILKKYDIEPATLYLELDFMKWKEILIERLERMSMEQVDGLKEELENSSLKEDIRFGYFMIVYTEQKLIKGVEEKIGIDEYNTLLFTFSQYTTKTYEAMFAEQLQEMEIEQLPTSYQAAMWLQIYFEEVDTDIKSALACLGKVATVYKTLANPMKYYLSILKERLI